jgi:hypothetical protein
MGWVFLKTSENFRATGEHFLGFRVWNSGSLCDQAERVAVGLPHDVARDSGDAVPCRMAEFITL